MKVRDIMTQHVIRIGRQEPAEVAARALTHYNVGILPVCGDDGRLCGLVTDRDIVTRCLAAGRAPEATAVSDVMTRQIVAARPDMEVSVAADLMGSGQIRRLPVMENGRLCGMVSLGDLAGDKESCIDAGAALRTISSNIASGRPR